MKVKLNAVPEDSFVEHEKARIFYKIYGDQSLKVIQCRSDSSSDKYTIRTKAGRWCDLHKKYLDIVEE